MTRNTRESVWVCVGHEEHFVHTVEEKPNRAVVKVYCPKCNKSMHNLGWIEHKGGSTETDVEESNTPNTK